MKKIILKLLVIGMVTLWGCKEDESKVVETTIDPNEQESPTEEASAFLEFKLDGQDFREEFPDDNASGLSMTNNQNLLQINYTFSADDNLKLNATIKFNQTESGTLTLAPEIDNTSYIRLTLRDQGLILYSKSGEITVTDVALVGKPVNDMQIAKVKGTFSGTFISKDALGEELKEYVISEGSFLTN